MTELTAPRVRRTTQQQLRVAHAIDDAAVDHLAVAVLDALATEHLTRSELAAALGAAGIELSGGALMILLAELELRMLVCSGRPAGDGSHTYARFDDRIPHPRRLDRDEALVELAVRYFTGHGPATEHDLAYWATLPLGDVRAGLMQSSARLESFEHDGRTFWHAPGERPPRAAGPPRGHLLQILDETYRGYQDSRWMLDADGIVPRSRESATGMALVDAQLVAAMKRTVDTARVIFELRPYRPLSADAVATLDAAAGRYGEFLGRAGVLDVR
jgi:hypothetical protein